jgi:hypothetical protein
MLAVHTLLKIEIILNLRIEDYYKLVSKLRHLAVANYDLIC